MKSTLKNYNLRWTQTKLKKMENKYHSCLKKPNQDLFAQLKNLEEEKHAINMIKISRKKWTKKIVEKVEEISHLKDYNKNVLEQINKIKG